MELDPHNVLCCVENALKNWGGGYKAWVNAKLGWDNHGYRGMGSTQAYPRSSFSNMNLKKR